jgi:ferritin-like metal-binding protein YciE
MPQRTPRGQLVRYLVDAHSIEEQALTQLLAAPEVAEEERLARLFVEHLAETQRHESLVRERLSAHGVDPSQVEDGAGKAGGYGVALFGMVQPASPCKLTAHAFAYEHLELAAYELLSRAAMEAGDERTASVASEIGEQERSMSIRLAQSFDAAVEASVRRSGPGELEGLLKRHLVDLYAIESQAIRILEAAPSSVDDEILALFLREHLEQTREHQRRVSERLGAHGGRPARIRDSVRRAAGLNAHGFFGAEPESDSTTRVAGFAYAFEHLEVAFYELLKRVALEVGDRETVRMAEATIAEEWEAAADIATTWDRTMHTDLAARAG